jgi:L-asparaginase / beta-aspartyl-peptidase
MSMVSDQLLPRFLLRPLSRLSRRHLRPSCQTQGLSQNSIAKDTSHITKLIQISRISHASFPRITLDDAIDLLAGTKEAWAWAVPSQPSKGRKLTRRGELALIQHFAGPVWLTHLDHLSVPFYQAYADSAADADTFKSKAKCADLLMGSGETAGLGERHSSPDTVRHALRHHHVPADTYQWYMDMRVEAPMQTVGWGLGLERYLLWLLRRTDVDIRDIPLLPRLNGSVFLP